MIAIDTNVLVYSHRAEMPLHARARDALKAITEAEPAWGLPVFCIGEFVRVVTHPRIFNPSTTLDVALAYVEHLLESPGVRLLTPGPSFPVHFARACRSGAMRGNLVFDAQIVALCSEHAVATILTEDRDFARFGELSVRRLADP